MSARVTTTVDEAQGDVREHAQGIVGELGFLVQEASGGSEVRDMVARAAKQTAGLDSSVRETQQQLAASQVTVSRLADKVEASNEQWKALAKAVDMVKASSGRITE